MIGLTKVAGIYLGQIFGGFGATVAAHSSWQFTFHVFGLIGVLYSIYTDGKEVNRVDGPVSRTEQFILVSTECMGYRNNPPVPDPALDRMVLPEYFEVDYVRVFDAVK